MKTEQLKEAVRRLDEGLERGLVYAAATRIRAILSALLDEAEQEEKDRARGWNPEECGWTGLTEIEWVFYKQGAIKPYYRMEKFLQEDGDFLLISTNEPDPAFLFNGPWPRSHRDGLELMRLLGIS